MPWEQEIEAFDTLSLPDFECALSTDRTDFFPMVFWADPSIVKKFPTLAALARGEFSGVAAEATSERTFSYSGRLFSFLETKCTDFGRIWREEFAAAHGGDHTPKVHLIERHVAEQARRHGTLGMFAEEGGEAAFPILELSVGVSDGCLLDGVAGVLRSLVHLRCEVEGASGDCGDGE